jgi:hypothetical protein
MWGAIIQAIDHALGRMNEGASAGIKVAKSQSGGAAPASNMSSDAGSSAAQDISNIAKNNDTGSEQAEVAEKAKIGSNATAEGNVPSSSNQGGSLGGSLGNIGSIGGGDAGAGEGAGEAAGGVDASSAADAAGSIVSDENTKSAKNVSSDKKEKSKDKSKDKSKAKDVFGAARSYGAGVGQGFANAGAIATGNGDAVEWNDIDVSKAKEAAEDTVKNWQKQRQEANKEQKPATTAEGK